MKKKYYWVIGIIVVIIFVIILILNFLPLLPGGYCLSDKQCTDFGMGDMCHKLIGRCVFLVDLPPTGPR